MKLYGTNLRINAYYIQGGKVKYSYRNESYESGITVNEMKAAIERGALKEISPRNEHELYIAGLPEDAPRPTKADVVKLTIFIMAVSAGGFFLAML